MWLIFESFLFSHNIHHSSVNRFSHSFDWFEQITHSLKYAENNAPFLFEEVVTVELSKVN